MYFYPVKIWKKFQNYRSKCYRNLLHFWYFFWEGGRGFDPSKSPGPSSYSSLTERPVSVGKLLWYLPGGFLARIIIIIIIRLLANGFIHSFIRRVRSMPGMRLRTVINSRSGRRNIITIFCLHACSSCPNKKDLLYVYATPNTPSSRE